MSLRIARAPGAPIDGAVIIGAPRAGAAASSSSSSSAAPARRGGDVEGLGFVSRDFSDLFRPLVGDFANKDPVELKPPRRVTRAKAEDVRGGFNPIGILCIKARLPGSQLSLEAIARGEYMKWAIAEALAEAISHIGKVRVRPDDVLFCADEVEILDVQMPFLGSHLWQFCEFRFDYRVAMKSLADAQKAVYNCFSGMVDFEAEFCKNLEYRFRSIYLITVLGLLNKRYVLMDGQQHTDELELFEAAQRNDVDTIEALVKKGVDVEATHKAASFPGALLDEDQRFLYVTLGRQPLLAAAEEGHIEAMARLIQAQADVNAQDASGFHALYLAAGVQGRSAQVVALLLEHDADVNLANTSGYTPLHNACGSGEVAALAPLLQAGASLNAKSKGGSAPVHVAVINGQSGALEALKARNANLDMPAFGGNTPVHEAVMQNDPGMIQKLFDLNANINIESGPDNAFATPLQMAIDRKKKKAARKLRELGASERLALDDEAEGGEDLYLLERRRRLGLESGGESEEGRRRRRQLLQLLPPPVASASGGPVGGAGAGAGGSFAHGPPLGLVR